MGLWPRPQLGAGEEEHEEGLSKLQMLPQMGDSWASWGLSIPKSMPLRADNLRRPLRPCTNLQERSASIEFMRTYDTGAEKG